MSNTRRRIVLVWLGTLAVCAVVVSRAEFSADLSAFLPRSPTPAQQLLVDQLRDGVVSRLLLAGIEGGTVAERAGMSQRLAARLRGQPAFVAVSNGESATTRGDQEFLWRNRYVLSPAVDAYGFSVEGLKASLQESLRLLGSAAGMLVQRTLPNDPTGELLRLVDLQAGQVQPRIQEGVWFAADGGRALLLLQTRAAGYDIDAQQAAIDLVRAAMALEDSEGRHTLRLSGPAVFSVESRDTIKREAVRISVIATGLIALLLLLVYRSPLVLALGLLPVASGALAGLAAVSLGFGEVHGITVGFGATLIGEGVDYAIYLFTQTAPGMTPVKTLERLWPTLRLGVATSVCGFGALLLSGFPGLAQLGLFSIVGLLVAVLFTRTALPALLPAGFAVRIAPTLTAMVAASLWHAPRLRYGVFAAAVLALGVLLMHRGPFWSDELSSLSPISATAQDFDRQLRRDMGAPDVRYLVVLRAPAAEAALAASERAAGVLDRLRRDGVLEGYDAPSDVLPSRETQARRQAALPAPVVLAARMREAADGLPFRANLFEPFLADVAAARVQPLLGRPDLEGTHLALKVDSLLIAQDKGVTVMLPLRGVRDPEAIRRELNRETTDAALVDMKAESDSLYQTYRDTALKLSLMGAAVIIVLLGATLRSARRVFYVVLPLFAAVTVTFAILLYLCPPLTIFHLVGLLLVVAVGSNYALFFDRQAMALEDLSRTGVSLLIANLATLIGFGLLGFSSVPVLQAIGTTVGIGAFLSLVFSAMLFDSRPAADQPAGIHRR